MFRTPDGYYLQSIDDVLKYYQKHKMLQNFSESIRKGFVAAQQEVRALGESDLSFGSEVVRADDCAVI
jgi:hypothetical protein